MRLYDERVLPRLIDLAMRGDEINALRARALTPARGRTLEVGFGTGLNARHYGPAVDELVVVDPNGGMTELAKRRLQSAGRTAEHVQMSGEALPFAEASFDTVVVTFTLCSIPDVARALVEMRRVLRPDGALLFCEHNLADDERHRRWQRRLTPLWSRFSGGCHLDRDAPRLLSAAGFETTTLERATLAAGPLFGTIRWGAARRA